MSGVTNTFRFLGPSNSQKKMPCQVPSASRPSSSGTSTCGPASDARTCDGAFSSPSSMCSQPQSSPTTRSMPRPTYVLEDGTGFFPHDYFRLADEAGGPDNLRTDFVARWLTARQAAQAADALEQDWEFYLAGTWGVCLRDVTPETIVRKNDLVSSLCELLVLARPNSPDWRDALRTQVDELDALEREFSPDYDRGDQQERPPTRDLLIAEARERYPDVFAEAGSTV